MKKNKIKYGNVEIVKQDGDNKLKFLMREEIVRVHSIPRDEMKKITRDEAISRFSKAAKERNIRMIYIRPFLPPQISEDPIKYNLEYLSMIQKDLESKGFVLGKAEDFKSFYPLGWQIIILGLGVVIGVLLLADCFVPITWYFTWPILLVSSFVFVFIGAGRYTFLLEKYLALIAAVVFPSYAVISQFSKLRPLPGKTTDVNAAYLVLNVFSETFIGIIIIVGLLSNTVFMLGSQGFVGIKFALILPIFIVATFFFFNSDKGFNFNSFREKMKNILSATFPVWVFGLVLVCLGLLFLLVARSGNFTIPVPQFEKMARMLLEKMLVIRPRTKEFLIGYPILMFSAFMFIRGKWKEWLPVALALGVIGPVSMLNSFCHLHTPVYVSIIRSISGLVIGIVVGWLAWFFVNRILLKK